MTLLAADIGNSQTTVGLVRGGDVEAHWRVSTDEHRTSDEWGVLLRGLLGTDPRLRGIAVCSSVPTVTAFSVTVTWISPGRFGSSN